MKKKIFPAILFPVLCILLFCAVSASAAETYEGLHYSRLNDEITITWWDESSTEVVIPYEIKGLPVTAIGKDAFYGCNGLESITIPNSIASIGEKAFHGCDNLTRVNITDAGAWCRISFSDIESNPLYYAKNLYLKGELVTDIDIPNEVTEVKNYAFSGCGCLTRITFPDSVTSVGYKAFYGCTALKTVDLPDRINYIGSDAFSGCSVLENITIPAGISTIDDSLFSGCAGLKTIIIPDGVTSINESAFFGCADLKSVTIPDSVNSIGNSAFSGCAGLKRITLPDKVTSIGNGTFDGCTNLENVTIPQGVITIGKSAFKNCESLTDIDLPDSIITIDDNAFYGCSGLKSIIIPNSVTTVGENAFYQCTGLTGVNITDIGAWCNISFENENANPLISAKNLYLDGKLVTELIISDGVTKINDYAFYNCINLERVTIGRDTTHISEKSFSYCYSLKYVFISAESLIIEEYAFAESSDIEYVFLAGNEPCWEKDGNESLTNATVVCNSVKKTYKFVTNCISILPNITDYAVFTSPTVKSDKFTFVGWYDNSALSGIPVSFPYYGSATTLYAAWTDRLGTSYDDALVINTNQPYTVTSDTDGQTVFFEFSPKRKKVYRFHTIGDKDTYGYLYDSNRTQISVDEDTGGNFSISCTLEAGETYYIIAKLSDGVGEFTLIAEELADYRIESITIPESAGNALASVPGGNFTVEISVTNVSSFSDTVIVLAQYTKEGAFCGCKYSSVTGLSIGATFGFTVHVDNTQGNIARIKAFCWDSFDSMTPLGQEISFGEV